MSILANAIPKHESTKLPCILGELVGFKSLEGGIDAMIIQRLNEDLQPAGLLTVTQGKAPTEQIGLQRNTISTFSNANSRNHIKPGAIVKIDQVVMAKDGKSAEAVFIRDMYTNEKDDARSVMVGLARPLPCRQGKDVAWVEVLKPENKKVATTAKEFGQALAEAWRDSMTFTQSYGIAQYSRNVIILTDDDNSKPHAVFINNVPIDPNETPIRYRFPKVEELRQQFSADQNIVNISRMLESQKGQGKVNVIPAARIMVPPKNVIDNRYTQSIKNHTGKFNINMGGTKGIVQEESIGYKKVVIGLWKGMISTLTPIAYCRPQLNEQESTIATPTGNTMNKASLSEEKGKLDDAAAMAAAAMAALTQNQAPTNLPPGTEYHAMDTQRDNMESNSEEISEFFEFDGSESNPLHEDENLSVESQDMHGGSQAASMFNSMNVN